MLFGVLALLAVVIVLPLALLARISQLERRIEQLRARLDRLDPQPWAAPTPPPIPLAPPPPGAEIEAAPETGTPIAPDLPPAVPAAPAGTAPAVPAAAAPAPAGPAPPRRIDIEQLIGGVWLQNVGAVLLLVGFFFLIVWGYATGRFGPSVLVIAGVLTGLGLVWRGATLRHTARGVGHALIGVGAGVVWLAVYLGHFRLGVLSTVPAFVCIAAASVFTGVLGARYRVQLIVVLGIVGAHLPSLLHAFIPNHAFDLPAAGLLAYLAGVNALVLLLAVRMGWNALNLASLILTACTWALAVPAVWWSWPIELGLAALFAALGIAPVAQLARPDTRARAVDVAVVAVAPLALLAASGPMFERAQATHVAMLMFGLAAVYVGVAAWVDQRRPERDVWRPLVAAAILFATIALERLLGPEQTALAWTIEGALLVWLGLRPRGEWLRWCGLTVIALGGFMLLGTIATGVREHPLPVVNRAALTAALAIAAMFVAVLRLLREEDRLHAIERAAAYTLFAGVNLLLMTWWVREASHFAWALERDGGAWRGARDIRGAPAELRYIAGWVTAVALGWMLQSAWLVWRGMRTRRLVERVLGYMLAGITTLVAIGGALGGRAWGRDLLPLVHRDALVSAATIAAIIFIAQYVARKRDALAPMERHAAKILAACASLIALSWITAEADHVARVIVDVPGLQAEAWRDVDGDTRRRLGAIAGTITSVGWLIQALVAFAIGWTMRSPFMRWMGLILVGITVFKFVFIDLAQADPFWRFLTAILAGAAMLGLSYLYQRRKRGDDV